MRRDVVFSLLAGATVSLGGATQAVASTAVSSNDEVRAIVADMMADAENRTSLLQGGGSGGHDGKFFLADSAGKFRLVFSGQIQFRYMASLRDEDGGEDDFDSGFQTRRTKLSFNGHVHDPNLIYKVKFSFDRDGGAAVLEDAWVGYKMDNGWTVKWGQFKHFILREEHVSSSKQLLIDRSEVNEFFTPNFVQGIVAEYKDEQFRVLLSFNDGAGSANTEFDLDLVDFAVSARVEFLIEGDWKQFGDFTSKIGSALGALLGASIHWQSGSENPGVGTDDPDIVVYSIDISVEGDGWNAFAAFIGSNTDPDAGMQRDDFGFVVQGGVYLNEDTELFARYDLLLQDDSIVTEDEFSTIAFGVNHYIHGHAAKITVDLVWYLDSSTGPGVSGLGRDDGIGRLGDNDEDEITIRIQFQLLF